MSEATFAVLALLVLTWSVTSGLLGRLQLNGPMFFLATGYVLGNPDWGLLAVSIEAPDVHLLAELTLALLLFSDASRVSLPSLRRDLGLPGRLLVVALPLSVVLGSLLAAWLLDDLTWALAGFVGATLAPTDAALSAQVINDDRIPMRLRQLLNVESGLNDGICTPIVAFAIAVAATQLGTAGHDPTVGGAVLELATGAGAGVSVGVGSALLVSGGARRGWITHGGRRLAALAAALGSFSLAVALGGNGFIAAFVAGLAFGALLDRTVADVEGAAELPELLGEVLAMGVWFLFGAALVPLALDWLDLGIVLYAVLSLTLVRVLPVALSLVGTGLDRQTVLLLGWFGPRGLASIVFAVLAVEELGVGDDVGPAVAAVSFTVLLSVLLHGVSAGPLAGRYARRERVQDAAETTLRSRRSG